MLIVLCPTLPISKNDDVAGLHPKLTIDLPNDDMSLEDCLEYLVKPALAAWGYGEEPVNRLVRPEFQHKLEYVNCPKCGYRPYKEIITGGTIDLHHSSDIDDQDLPTGENELVQPK